MVLVNLIGPKENKKDLEDVPKEVMKDLTFKYVTHMDEVLGVALTKPLPKTKVADGRAIDELPTLHVPMSS